MIFLHFFPRIISILFKIISIPRTGHIDSARILLLFQIIILIIIRIIILILSILEFIIIILILIRIIIILFLFDETGLFTIIHRIIIGFLIDLSR